MPSRLDQLRSELRRAVRPEKAAFLPGFFKVPAGYPSHDKFLGVVVPDQRKVAKLFKGLPLADLATLLASEWHEERLTALFIMVAQFQKGDAANKKSVYELYMRSRAHVDNWDLVDSSAAQIVGAWLDGRAEKLEVLQKLAVSHNWCERRIAMIATHDYIKKGRADEALIIAEKLLHDEHDLIQKAVGWMLRELGKRAHDGRCPARIAALRPPVRARGMPDTARLRSSAAPCAASPDNDLRCKSKLLADFLDTHAATMPRTTLRYAIEHFPPDQRRHYLGLARAVQ